MDNLYEVPIYNLDDDKDMGNGVASNDSVSGDCTNRVEENDSGNREPSNVGDTHNNDERNEAPMVDVGGDLFKRITELTSDDILGLEFGSQKEAYEFYNQYAKAHGFVIRKDEIKRDVKGNIVMRQFVCNREGLRNKRHLMRLDRKRDHRAITRTNCEAKLRIRFNRKKTNWRVVSFEESHNHELTPPRFVHLHSAYRKLTEGDKAQVDSLHSHGVRTCHIMGYMLAQKGGYSNVGFARKDVYNYIDSNNRVKIKDGDALAALSYLKGRAAHDPTLFAEFRADDKGKLKHLFWADGMSISDFHCFGDVVAFDTTYRKNRYNYLLVIFSGCNHHSLTSIFGCALVSDETTATYKWVLEAFLIAMGNKHPKAVVTDGDAAMREAIKQVFPDSCHRLCVWHLHNNACENVKCGPFSEDFKTAMYSNFTKEEFEDFWKKIVDKHGLVGNKWVSKTYENRSLWATAYLRDKFFGRIRTTSQCEAINAILKTYVKKNSSIIEFMHKFEQALREYRNNELSADFKSLFSEPVLTTCLHKFEKEAAKIYTLEIFKEVRQQIDKAGALIVIDRAVNRQKLTFTLNRYCNPGCGRHVLYDTVDCSFICDCRLFESRGIPCSHIFCAMKNKHVDFIPSSLILKRWTKNAKSELISSYRVDEVHSDVLSAARISALSAYCNNFVRVAYEKTGCFGEIVDDIFNLQLKYEKKGDPSSTSSSARKIGDPTVVKTKGAPKKSKFSKKRKRHCSNCSGTGHTIRTCPKVGGIDVKADTDGETSPSERSNNNRSNDSDKNEMEFDVSNTQVPVPSENSSGRNIKKGKEKVDPVSTSKVKKVKGKKEKDSSQKQANEVKIESMSYYNGGGMPNIHQAGCSTGVMPNFPQMRFPSYGYGPMNHGVSMMPHYDGGHCYPQTGGVPLYPQHHQFFSQIPSVHNGSSWHDLLQHVSQNRGDCNSNNLRLNPGGGA